MMTELATPIIRQITVLESPLQQMSVLQSFIRQIEGDKGRLKTPIGQLLLLIIFLTASINYVNFQIKPLSVEVFWIFEYSYEYIVHE